MDSSVLAVGGGESARHFGSVGRIILFRSDVSAEVCQIEISPNSVFQHDCVPIGSWFVVVGKSSR